MIYNKERAACADARGGLFLFAKFQIFFLFCLTYLYKYSIIKTWKGGEQDVKKKTKKKLLKLLEIVTMLATLTEAVIEVIRLLKGG